MRVFSCGRKKRLFSTVAIDAKGHYVAAGGGALPTLVWDLRTGAEDSRLDLAITLTEQLAFAGGRLLLPTADGLFSRDLQKVTTWGLLAEGEYAGPLALDAAGKWGVCWHNKPGSRGAPSLTAFTTPAANSVTLDWSLSMSDRKRGRTTAQFLACLPGGKTFLSSEWVVTRRPDNSVCSLVVRSRKDGGILSEVPGLWAFGNTVVASPASDVFVVLCGTRFRVHRVEDLAEAHQIRHDGKKHFTAAAFHPTGHHLLAANKDGTVKLYDVRSWELVRAFTWDIGPVRSVCFSPDGHLAAAGSDDGKVAVWDVDV